MIQWKRWCVSFLSLCVLNFFLAGTVFSQENWYARADITKNKPVIRTLPEEKIPVETVKDVQAEGGSGKWLWAILGVALVGGIAAAAGGGGGGSGGGGSGGDDDTGDVTVSW